MVTLTSVLLISIMVFVVLQLLTPWLFPVEVISLIELDSINQLSFMHHSLYQILFVLGNSLFYLLIMFYLTLVTKNMLVSLFVLSTYTLFLPILGRFDLKNIILTIYPKVFDTNATTFHINESIDLPLKHLGSAVPDYSAARIRHHHGKNFTFQRYRLIVSSK